MISVRRASERAYERRRMHEAWLTFSPKGPSEEIVNGFGSLELFKEGRLPPRSAAQGPRQHAEILTYVREGTLAYEDSMGRSGLICAGEFQRMTAGDSIRYDETNTSPTEWAHVFQLWLRPSVVGVLPAGHEQKRFSVADRRGALCIVASPDARGGSLLIHQDACLYSSILSRGQHVVHELSEGRGAWLHIVDGSAQVGEFSLGTGDGAGIIEQATVSLTAIEETEVLLLDLGEVVSVEAYLN